MDCASIEDLAVWEIMGILHTSCVAHHMAKRIHLAQSLTVQQAHKAQIPCAFKPNTNQSLTVQQAQSANSARFLVKYETEARHVFHQISSFRTHTIFWIVILQTMLALKISWLDINTRVPACSPVQLASWKDLVKHADSPRALLHMHTLSNILVLLIIVMIHARCSTCYSVQGYLLLDSLVTAGENLELQTNRITLSCNLAMWPCMQN